MGVEDALVSNLFQGFMICFPVIWVVLLLVTGNVILAFYATFSIACIVICVLGAAKGYSGWCVMQARFSYYHYDHCLPHRMF